MSGLLIWRKNGQGILDYVLLLLVVIAVLLIMGYYIRNTISGKMREGADVIGRGDVYRPGSTEVISNTIENNP